MLIRKTNKIYFKCKKFDNVIYNSIAFRTKVKRLLPKTIPTVKRLYQRLFNNHMN